MNPHIFKTETEAKAFISKINKGEGIPKKGSLTTTYTNYYFKDNVYKVDSDEITNKYI